MNDTNNKSSAIFTPSGCLTGDALMLFVSGSLPDSDLQPARQHISECPLCADAADGLKMWLQEQPDSIKPTAGSQSETSELSGKSHFEKGNKSKSSATAAYKFHTRTEAINDRVKQRVNFHKQVESVQHKRRQIKPYAWIGAAATVVLFVGIYYAIQVQKTFNKLSLVQESEIDEMVAPSGDHNKANTSDSMHSQAPALALKEEKQSGRKRSSEIPNAIPVISNDEISSFQDISITEDVSPEEIPEPEKFDTSVTENNNSPTEVAGTVITAYKVPAEKKSMGYAVMEEKPVQEIDGVKVNKSKRSENTEKESEEMIFTVVEQMPVFPGGQEKMMDYLSDNLDYPESAKESGIQGTVYVSFVVRKDGRISDIKILKGIGGGCDEEAVRVVSKMPRWKPATQRGKKVDVLFNLPIVFKLD
jgi:TonB family protein